MRFVPAMYAEYQSDGNSVNQVIIGSDNDLVPVRH